MTYDNQNNRIYDIDYFTERVKKAIQTYISDLRDPERIYNVDVFSGLIDYCYIHCFKPDRRNNPDINYFGAYGKTSILDYDNIELLYDIWELYKQVCCYCEKTPTILQYCVFTGLSHETIYRWGTSGLQRDVTFKHKEFYKRLSKESETATVNKVLNSQQAAIGAMFVLKAVHGYREADNTVNVTVSPQIQTQTADEIAAKYADAKLPELPNLELPDNLVELDNVAEMS